MFHNEEEFPGECKLAFSKIVLLDVGKRWTTHYFFDEHRKMKAALAQNFSMLVWGKFAA